MRPWSAERWAVARQAVAGWFRWRGQQGHLPLSGVAELAEREHWGEV